jgi:hypothetical protein
MSDYHYHVKNLQKVSSKSKQCIFKLINRPEKVRPDKREFWGLGMGFC